MEEPVSKDASKIIVLSVFYFALMVGNIYFFTNHKNIILFIFTCLLTTTYVGSRVLAKWNVGVLRFLSTVYPFDMLVLFVILYININKSGFY